MKTCSIEGCNSNVWGGSVCKYHQYTRRMKGGDLYQPKQNAKFTESNQRNNDSEKRSLQKGTKIPPESKKRKKEHIRYLDEIKKYWQECVENKTNFCFFCGEYSNKMLNNHHLKGRTGDCYLDKDFWVWGHNFCHVEVYHGMSWDKQSEFPWWDSFLQRLKAKSIDLYNKELKRQEKSIPLFQENDIL